LANFVQALVVGGGISGLVCAHALKKSGISVALLEASLRPGGVIGSARREGFLIEKGPQSFTSSAELDALSDELGLAKDRVVAPDRAPRYVLVDGKLRQVPMNPFALLSSSLVDGGAKWGLLRDAFGRSAPPAEDESIATFVRRKFSAQILERFVGPIVSGIFAGDPEKLSVRAAFPQLYESEKSSGSIIRGMSKARKTARGGRPRPSLQSYRDGNETLVRGLAEKLGHSLRCGVQITRVQKLSQPAAAAEARYGVTLRCGDSEEIVEAQHVIVATPTEIAAEILRYLDVPFAAPLAAVEYAAVAVVSLGYRKSEIAHSLDGFGFLVPRSAGLRILGTVWNSSLFPGRAPEGHLLLTSFVGGASDPDAATLSSEELAVLVHREISPLLGIKSGLAFSNVTVWPRAIPQYNLGHGERVAQLEKLQERFPGIWFAGNFLHGPSIAACTEQALKVTGQVKAACAR
jgi:oxygen-dependent protoporphyrinogen oxidase